jgi:hypothetical protein
MAQSKLDVVIVGREVNVIVEVFLPAAKKLRSSLFTNTWPAQSVCAPDVDNVTTTRNEPGGAADVRTNDVADNEL